MFSPHRAHDTTYSRTRTLTQTGDTQSLESAYFTDKNGVPLARPVPRKELGLTKLMSNLTWTSETSRDTTESSVIEADADFERTILRDVSHNVPEKTSALLKERIGGTMNLYRDQFKLPRSADAVRRRQEHVDGRIVQTPVLLSDYNVSGGASAGIAIIYNAVISELRDFHIILSSLQARKYDINSADIKAVYEWYGLLENFIRVYFVASEREIYAKTEVDKHIVAHGSIAPEQRKIEKMRIVRLCEKVEALKRPLLAMGRKCGQSVGTLHKQVDKLTMRLVRFLKEEVEQLPSALESRLTRTELIAMYTQLVSELREGKNGKEIVVLIGQGAGSGAGDRMSWVREVCGGVSKFTAQGWVNRFGEKHRNYVHLFQKAEKEYRQFYGKLSRIVDEEIADIRIETRSRASP